MTRLALVGDFSPQVLAHRAIEAALARVRDEPSSLALEWTWVGTDRLSSAGDDLDAFTGLWLVPGSPYTNTAGALAAVRWAREKRRPFLGTCGGFQHAIIEFARNVAGLTTADHTETNPASHQPVITRLACSLVEATGALQLSPGSRLREIYGADSVREGYRCNYGPNPDYLARLETAGLRFTAFDEAGAPRGGELPVATHPFFVGTLFQPERAALRGETPPLVRAFAQAAHLFS